MSKQVIIEIVNVIATVDFETPIDIIRILDKIPHAEYNPKEFPGVILRLENPRTSVLIFNSGKMICAGTKSIALANKAAFMVISKLQRNKIISFQKPPKIKVQNIVASLNYKEKIMLDQCARNLPKSMYEPEQFPALIHKMTNPTATALIYKNGRIICTGIKTQAALYRAVNSLKQILSMNEPSS